MGRRYLDDHDHWRTRCENCRPDDGDDSGGGGDDGGEEEMVMMVVMMIVKGKYGRNLAL